MSEIVSTVLNVFKSKHSFAFLPIFLISLVAIVILLDGSHPTRLFTGKLKCQYNLIYGYKEPVDFAVFGSSRAMLGVDASLISKNSINLSRNWRGIGQMYFMAEELIEHRGVKKGILVQVSHNNFIGSATSTYYYGYYPNFNVTTPPAFLIEDFHSKATEPFVFRVADLGRDIFTFFNKSLNHIMTNEHVSFDKEYSNTNNCTGKDNKVNTTRLVAQDKKIKKIIKL